MWVDETNWMRVGTHTLHKGSMRVQFSQASELLPRLESVNMPMSCVAML